ncbi:hypothetical protein Palpr_2329 [Paludibacter propionicigenes WB4]|uniref:Aminoglycoside phosphotransferase domain-containing protein n=1 Tax=Paludibacter propionicigenes (strain DSM 17365 / JCM 13257 / WB4) TaxID=694427 RepID=E4T6X0_PALPW|nr:phosphotransferase [Paludibacter propionicigenes]ADQ80464.1 hypothetical protein Palpr_2329 [Paludibacter propionicigenes WB4]
MRYYYFNPFSRAYYFPKGFKNYSLFTTFYKPYKLSARLMWQIWQISSFVRYLFSTSHPEEILPLEQIGQFVTPSSILAFNFGTDGIEKKTTVLGVDTITNDTFFIKYATKETACKNVFNEGVVLQQIKHLSFVPTLQLIVNMEHEFTLIKTTVLSGEKMKHEPINEEMLTILFTLADQQVESNRIYDSNLRSCFAHGDFCPWNILIYEGAIKLFDWELAGQYLLGYDLFTYVFQYEFIVKEKMRFELILKENSDIIQRYFHHFEIDNWIPYLQEFSKLRHRLESDKNDIQLIEYYLRLKDFSTHNL